ncbi:MAG: 50S ribosomal protein L4 [Acidimicrobiaceae bacterium]|nr:50S ribosomal protein L4 [Acidimicrobiaceae bacterium]MDE0608088.1 50S ribosomal protein L4 [Acidimicrobiaceae bacterium]
MAEAQTPKKAPDAEKTVIVKTQQGADAGKVALAADLFDVEPNIAVMHQVVTAQLAARRAGTHSTKSRSEVRGGGAKPWRQKGTGRARAGSRNSPIWRGGGIAHGPKPRDYSQRTPKKMIKLALAGALSDRACEGNVIVVDEWSFETPKTKDASAALEAIGAVGKVLVVLGDDDGNAQKSFRNLPHVSCLHSAELNTHDVLDSDVVVFTKATLDHATTGPQTQTGNEEEQ